jgi:hypothetical protein
MGFPFAIPPEGLYNDVVTPKRGSPVRYAGTLGSERGSVAREQELCTF